MMHDLDAENTGYGNFWSATAPSSLNYALRWLGERWEISAEPANDLAVDVLGIDRKFCGVGANDKQQ